DDVLRLRREVGVPEGGPEPGLGAPVGGAGVLAEQADERRCAEREPGGGEEVPAGEGLGVFLERIHGEASGVAGSGGWKPMRRFGPSSGGGWSIFRRTSPITRSCSSWSWTVSANRWSWATNSPGVASSRRMRTNARMISMFTRTAVGDRSTLESIATPCSVNTRGNFRLPPYPELEVTNCDFKFLNSCSVSRNAKSSGNRSRFRLTAWLSTLVGTPYSDAKSESSITRCPRMMWISPSTRAGVIASVRFFAVIVIARQ